MKLNRIYVFLFGGLGNQLFQFAYAHYVSESTQRNVTLLDATGRIRVKRKFELKKLLLECHHGIDGTALPVMSVGLSKLLNVIHKRFTLFDLKESQNFPTFNFGQYQDIKYIMPIKALLLDEILSVTSKIQAARSLQILNGVTVAIHIRRGDYNKAYHGHLALKFYNQILELLKYDRLIVHTDDFNILKELHSIFPDGLIYGPGDASPWEVLSDLANSNIVIAANSTLSWWGAWICAQRGGIAYLPKIWFRQAIQTPPLNVEGFILSDPIWE